LPSYDEEKWIQLYKSALIELEHSLLTGRIAEAREEIVKRVAALRDMPGIHDAERQAIEDALSSLRFLEREEAKYQANEQRKRAEAALEKLRSIAPKIAGNDASK
jgi:hypothetical protein